MYLGKPKTSSNIAWHRPQSEVARLEEELMKQSSESLATVNDPLEKLRLLCFSGGACGIMRLARIFRRMDSDGSERLTKEEFFKVIKETGLELNGIETEELFDSFDEEKCGSISVDEFIKKLRPEMSESRCAIVKQAFRKLDKSEHGVISIEDIKKLYSVNSYARYKSGEESADKIMNAFLANFENLDNDDGKVTLEDFMNYYSGISLTIDKDIYFDLMMRQAFTL